MKTYAKVHNYIQTHKKPVTIEFLANYYLASKPAVATALRQLEEMELVKRRKDGRKVLWYNAN